MIRFMRRLFPPQPHYTRKVSGSTVRALLDVHVVRTLDRDYVGVSIDTFMKFAKFDSISNVAYVPEIYDCDDFAFAFFVAARKWAPGIPVGIVMGHTTRGTPHAWNCFVDVMNEKVHYFEPQNDVMFEPTTENIWEIII